MNTYSTVYREVSIRISDLITTISTISHDISIRHIIRHIETLTRLSQVNKILDWTRKEVFQLYVQEIHTEHLSKSKASQSNTMIDKSNTNSVGNPLFTKNVLVKDAL